MPEHSDNPIGTPWWVNSMLNDYTCTRSGLQYNSVDDLIGRRDSYKYTLTANDPTTVSGGHIW